MKEEQATIVIQVQPNANRNEVMNFESGVWHIRIAAPPIKGKANQELIRFLSGILSIRKDSLIIKKGITNKRKVIAIKGLNQKQVMDDLQNQRSRP